jgi:uncharacterized protein
MTRFPLAFLVAALMAACHKDAPAADEQRYAHLMTFDSATIHIVAGRDTLPVRVEIARSRAQQTMGLMERRHLDEDGGMLFVYDSTQPPDAGFWMYRTRIPLDIAFMDSAGVVRSTRAMAPCEAELIEGCPAYAPGVPYRYALEVNGGYLARHHVGIGGIALLPPLSAPRTAK